jgi:short-subunit dehydrogenase
MGLALVRQATASGAKVIISNRSVDKLKAAAAELSNVVQTYAADASKMDEAERLMRDLASRCALNAIYYATNKRILDLPVTRKNL